MGALLGSAAALCIGLSELFGRQVVSRTRVLTVLVAMSVGGALVSVAVAFVIGGTWIWSDAGFGAVSGIGLAAGLGFYYVGLDRSSATIVSPMAATLSAVMPYGYALLRGEEASTIAIAGAAIAFVGLVVVAVGALDLEHLQTGLLWGVLSGVGYGVGVAMFVEVSDESGAWAGATQRIATSLVFVLLALVARAQLMPPRPVRGSAAAASFFVGLTSVAWVLGIQVDAPSAIVTTSMYPVVSVAVGFFVFSDAVSRRQIVGIGLALLGIALVVGG